MKNAMIPKANATLIFFVGSSQNGSKTRQLQKARRVKIDPIKENNLWSTCATVSCMSVYRDSPADSKIFDMRDLSSLSCSVFSTDIPYLRKKIEKSDPRQVNRIGSGSMIQNDPSKPKSENGCIYHKKVSCDNFNDSSIKIETILIFRNLLWYNEDIFLHLGVSGFDGMM